MYHTEKFAFSLPPFVTESLNLVALLGLLSSGAACSHVMHVPVCWLGHRE
jgi:hypothetical protein